MATSKKQSSPAKKFETGKQTLRPPQSKLKAMAPPKESQLIPNPELVITQSLSGSYLKLLEVANALKLHRAPDEHYMFKNSEVEVELLQLVLEKVYQLRVKSQSADGMVDAKTSALIQKILLKSHF
jgi:hypothetical protein